MTQTVRRHRTPVRLGALLLVLALAVLVACTPKPPKDGFVDGRHWENRQQEYLRHATAEFNPNRLESILAQFVRHDRSPDHTPELDGVTADGLAGEFGKLDRHADTSDFDLMRVWVLWHTHRQDLPKPVADALQQRILDFRYWYTDPKPEVGTDQKWFWSENHQLIVHTAEYLAGQDLPETTFTITGLSGRAHHDRARAKIMSWLDEKARWGFSEWHSDVYYAEDIQPLLMLSQYGDDEISARANAMLDVLFADLAVHQLDGNMGVTHGRTYMKDKSRARDQDVHDVIELLFGKGDEYNPGVDFTALLLAGNTRYRPAQALQKMAEDPAPITDRQHMNVPLDPALAVTDDPKPPPGTSFTDPEAIPFWWERGAMAAWQVAPLTLQTLERQELWDNTFFRPYAQMRPLVDDPASARYLARALQCPLNAGLLSEVDTVTHRSRYGMLSSAQDYKPGCPGQQYHAWQATLDADAVVFTTHPANEDRGAWADSDLYWNGGASMPRTAQQANAAINIYAPNTAGGGSTPQGNKVLLTDYTHAFFPTQHFDEVKSVGHWTFGRKGDGYVALYSWRDTHFTDVAPNPAGLKEPYDLIADGGATNAWITELGNAEQYGSFDAFVSAIGAADVTVTETEAPGTVGGGLAVDYASPSQQRMTFGTTAPFTVAGQDVPLHHPERISSPYATIAPGQNLWNLTAGGAHLETDLATGRRSATLD